jgi:hypothetical protein
MTAGTARTGMAIISLTRGYEFRRPRRERRTSEHRGMGRRLRNLRKSLQCFRTTSKIVVFESDDWGLDGISCRDAYDALVSEGVIDPDNRFNKCGRETVEDLALLYEILAEFRDSAGRPPAFTANFVMANPDFESIRASDFREYSWVAIDDAIRRPYQAGLLTKYREGMKRGLLRPQYHGRDHIGAETWLRALRDGDPVAHSGLCRRVAMSRESRFLENEYVESRAGRLTPLPREILREKIRVGSALFSRAFGMRSLTSIAPFYLWSDDVEELLREEGIRGMQAGSHRLCAGDGLRAPVHRQSLLGECGPAGLVHLIRDSQFEPSRDGESAVQRCLSDIAAAFLRGLPAVIDTHRVNYVGAVDRASRDKNLQSLRDLVRQILQRFPTVRFATSDELVDALVSHSHEAAGETDAGSLMPAASLARRVLCAASERVYWKVHREER